MIECSLIPELQCSELHLDRSAYSIDRRPEVAPPCSSRRESSASLQCCGWARTVRDERKEVDSPQWGGGLAHRQERALRSTAGCCVVRHNGRSYGRLHCGDGPLKSCQWVHGAGASAAKNKQHLVGTPELAPYEHLHQKSPFRRGQSAHQLLCPRSASLSANLSKCIRNVEATADAGAAWARAVCGARVGAASCVANLAPRDDMHDPARCQAATRRHVQGRAYGAIYEPLAASFGT